MTKQRILLVYDHEVVRLGLKALLDRHPNFEVIAEAGTAREAIERVAAFTPDVVVMDIRLYRDGQSPEGGVHPSRDQVAEDLRILAKNWRLIRVYSADRHGEDVLELIRRETLDLKVMLGIWLGREPGGEQGNARQIANGIRLANLYHDVVVAVNVGNEVLIEWTAHPVRPDQVIRYVREVKASVTKPVTVADNYVWWRDHGTALAREVDFITIHSYPIWERKDIDEGLAYTVGMGIFPGFEFTGRLTELTNVDPGFEGQSTFRVDKAFDIKYEVIPESKWLPALALG